MRVRDGVTAGKDGEWEPGDGSGMFGDDQPGIQAISQDPAQPCAHRRGGFANPQQPHAPKICQAIFTPGNIQNISGAVDKALHGRARFQRVDGGGEDAGDGIAFLGKPQAGGTEDSRQKTYSYDSIKACPNPEFSSRAAILESGMNLIQDFCEADIWPEELPPSRQAILDHVHGMDGLLCLLTDQIDAEIMDAAGAGLKVISNYAVGIDNVDVAAASARGIPVGNTPGVLTDATADMAFALLLAAAGAFRKGNGW